MIGSMYSSQHQKVDKHTDRCRMGRPLAYHELGVPNVQCIHDHVCHTESYRYDVIERCSLNEQHDLTPAGAG